MRIWNISPSLLCRKQLLGEHREVHAAKKIVIVLYEQTNPA